MVQQLSLFGSISKPQLKLTLDSLTTLTGSKPLSYQTLTILSPPSTIVKFEPNSKNTQYEQHKLHLKTTYNKDIKSINDYKDWILQTVDIPSAGKRKISIQLILETYLNLQKNQTITQVMKDLGYDIDTRYLITGYRFFYGNITIEIFQIDHFFHGNELRPLDENLYVVKTFINVEKATDVEHLNKSGQELLNLKAELQGLLELEIPDRTTMDSRIGIRK